jgi:hypothetical protein
VNIFEEIESLIESGGDEVIAMWRQMANE